MAGWVSTKVRAHQKALELLAAKRGCRLIDMALSFDREQTDLEGVVLGICSIQELNQLQAAWLAKTAWEGSEWRTWALKDKTILDPRQWPRRGS